MVRMGLRLFHKRSHKRSRSGTNLSGLDASPTVHEGSQPSQTLDAFQSNPKRQRTARTEPNKLRRRNRTYSFPPGREDSIRVTGSRQNHRRISPQRKGKHVPSSNRTPFLSSHNQSCKQNQQSGGPVSRNELREWYRVPTLQNLPPNAQTKRAKSSRRRRVDRQREAEIRALTIVPEPVRPSVEQWMAGRPMGKDSRRTRTGKYFGQLSDISLPSAPSIRSNMSVDSEYASWKVSALESLAPRPTLRMYSNIPAYHIHAQADTQNNPVYGPGGKINDNGPVRTQSQNRKFCDRPPIPEATLRAHKRIDDLADEFTASDIRELMERDKRRRERRKQREQERIERRLARQARAQREEARQGSSTPSLERGVLGRELAGLGVAQPPSAVVTSSRARTSVEDNDSDGKTSSNCESTSSSQPRPLDHFHRPESAHMHHVGPYLPTPPPDAGSQAEVQTQHVEVATVSPADFADSAAVEEATDEVPSVASAPSSVVAAASPAESPVSGIPERKSSINRRKSDRRVLQKKSRSKSPPSTHRQGATSSQLRRDDVSTTRQSSETGTSSRASRLSWTAIFKWAGRRRMFGGPSSFSNASRESMQVARAHNSSLAAVAAASSASAVSLAAHLSSVPSAPNVNSIPTQRDAGPYPPRRTVSRFREDLPETSLSLPRSQTHSPNAGIVPYMPSPVTDEHMEPENHSTEPTPIGDRELECTYREGDRVSPTSLQLSSVDPSPEPQSISLASLDSEGSWFGGGLGGSSRTRKHVNSLSVYQQHEQQQQLQEQGQGQQLDKDGELCTPTNVENELSVAEDEHLPLLNPALGHGLRMFTEEGRPSPDGEEAMHGEATWGSLPRTPNVVHPKPRKMKSSEALLNASQDREDIEMADAETSKELQVDENKEEGVDDTESDSAGEKDLIGVQRATSIHLGHSHVRHISAGSAKLLELTPRASVEVRRRSTEPPASITQ